MKYQNPLKSCDSLGCKMGYTLKAMVTEMCRRFDQNEIDLTPEQFFVLNILNDHEGLILQDLADMLDKDKSAVMRHIDALEEKHFITRATCKDDKRKKLLILTKPGINTLSKANKISEATEKEVTKDTTDKELKTFREVLFSIVNNIPTEPAC